MTSWEGHDVPERALLAALSGGRLHHGWILAGPEGIGKASFARRAAPAILAETPPDHFDALAGSEAARLIEAGSHPDVRVVRRELRDAKPDAELKRSIAIDQIRALQALLGARPAMARRKLVIIDSVDELERGGANALLKSLEEPTGDTVFLLISHAPDRLLPTVRSRCRMLRFAPLADDAMRRAIAEALPEAGPADIAALVAIGQGAPGQALAHAGLGLGEIDALIEQLMTEGDSSGRRAAALAALLSGKAAQPRYEAFLTRTVRALADQARKAAIADLPALIANWKAASDLALRAGPGPLTLDKPAVVTRMAGLLAAVHPPREAA